MVIGHSGDSLSIMYLLWVTMLLRMCGWQRSSYPLPKSYYQSFNQFMACDGSYAIVNEICNLIGIGMSSTFS